MNGESYRLKQSRSPTPAPVRIIPLAPVGPQAPPTRGPPVDDADNLPPRQWRSFTPPPGT